MCRLGRRPDGLTRFGCHPREGGDLFIQDCMLPLGQFPDIQLSKMITDTE